MWKMAGVAGLEPSRRFIGFSSKSIISNEINDFQYYTTTFRWSKMNRKTVISLRIVKKMQLA
jgi:hypothetical protein